MIRNNVMPFRCVSCPSITVIPHFLSKCWTVFSTIFHIAYIVLATSIPLLARFALIDNFPNDALQAQTCARGVTLRLHSSLKMFVPMFV